MSDKAAYWWRSLAEPRFVQTNLARRAVNISPTCADYDNIRAALKQRWVAAIDAGMPVNEMAERIINWALTGRGFRKRFGLDAVSAPIAKQLVPEAVFFRLHGASSVSEQERSCKENPSTSL